jgi:alpha-ketoglutarate-dependent taurine dioxygenase
MNVDLIIESGMNVPMVVASHNNLKAGKTPLLDLINDHHVEIIKQLSQYGAVLFRGFACQDVAYFSKAIELCGLGSRCSTSDYDLARTLLPNDIYTSSDLPAHVPLPLHHEKPRSKNPPNHIYFCCVTKAEKGGGTVFANAAEIWLDIPKNIQDKIIKHGVQYKQFFHGKSIKHYLLKKTLGNNSARSWKEYFGTDDKMQVEKKLTADNVIWDWVNNGNDLILLNNLSGARKHPITNQTIWFNSSAYLNYYSNLIYGELHTLRSYKYLASRYLILKDMLPMVCHYGNGQAFSSDDIAKINRVLQHHAWVLNWEEGDFMIVDNFTFMHGKQAHEGDRLLYSCMTQV